MYIITEETTAFEEIEPKTNLYKTNSLEKARKFIKKKMKEFIESNEWELNEDTDERWESDDCESISCADDCLYCLTIHDISKIEEVE